MDIAFFFDIQDMLFATVSGACACVLNDRDDSEMIDDTEAARRFGQDRYAWTREMAFEEYPDAVNVESVCEDDCSAAIFTIEDCKQVDMSW